MLSCVFFHVFVAEFDSEDEEPVYPHSPICLPLDDNTKPTASQYRGKTLPGDHREEAGGQEGRAVAAAAEMVPNNSAESLQPGPGESLHSKKYCFKSNLRQCHCKTMKF